MRISAFFVLLPASALVLAQTTSPEPAKPTAPRVGIYDSRVVAFAHFWSESASRERDALLASAKAAKAVGDTARLKDFEAKLRAAQTRSHLQVFSTAPAEEAMAALKEKLPALRQELGVVRFVSKWDEAALRDIPRANQVDVTDRLAREFNPDAKRLKTIEQMKASKPLPLAEATRLAEAGKL